MSETREFEIGNSQFAQARSASRPAPQWFAAYTTPRHEKYVSKLLTERRIETFLPLYGSPRQSRPVVLQLPLFPTYVLLQIAPNAQSLVLGIPGVISIVGSSAEPWPLPDREIEALRLEMQVHEVEPHPYLRIGERVLVKSGFITGVEGILTRKYDELRVIIAFDAIMRSISMEVIADDLEPVDTVAEMGKEALL